MLLQNIIKSLLIKCVDEAWLDVVPNEDYATEGGSPSSTGYTGSPKDS